MRRRTTRNRYSRRAFLASLTVATRAAEPAAKGRIFPSVAVRYPDPATEFTVVRLTDPQFNSSLPAGVWAIAASRRASCFTHPI